MKFWRPALALALSGISCGGSAPAPRPEVDAVALAPPYDSAIPPAPDGPPPSRPDAAPPPAPADAGLDLPPPAPDAATSEPPFSARCPAGPFPAPVVGDSEAVCTDFPFGPPYNEGPTWVAGQGAFYFS